MEPSAGTPFLKRQEASRQPFEIINSRRKSMFVAGGMIFTNHWAEAPAQVH